MGDPIGVIVSANRHDGTWQTILLSGLVCRESTYIHIMTMYYCTVRYNYAEQRHITVLRLSLAA